MTVRLAGLDGTSPLAFMAALGALRVADERLRHHDGEQARLSWSENGFWTPTLWGPQEVETVVDWVLEDAATWPVNPAFRFGYTRDGRRGDPDEPGVVRDLKPPPAVMRAFLDEVAQLAACGDARAASTAAAYGTDVAVDNSGNTKPTALHFAAGLQTFLGAVAEIHEALTRDDEQGRTYLIEALAGPWRRTSPVKTLGWDQLGAFTARPYALRASDPAGEKRPGMPGAEWLAYLGLSFFPTVPRGRAVHTTCVTGGWKDATFTWPLWTGPATARSVASLLRTPRLNAIGEAARASRGVAVVCSARIHRSEQGGYGGFAPTVRT